MSHQKRKLFACFTRHPKVSEQVVSQLLGSLQFAIYVVAELWGLGLDEVQVVGVAQLGLASLTQDCREQVLVGEGRIEVDRQNLLQVSEGKQVATRASQGFEYAVNREVFAQNQVLLRNFYFSFAVNRVLQEVHKCLVAVKRVDWLGGCTLLFGSAVEVEFGSLLTVKQGRVATHRC